MREGRDKKDDVYLRRSGPVTMPVVVVGTAVVVVDVVVVVEPVFIVGMTAADSFSFSFSLSALSSDQYLFTHTHTFTGYLMSHYF